jgi:uncharacterized protein (DUF58 family)
MSWFGKAAAKKTSPLAQRSAADGVSVSLSELLAFREFITNSSPKPLTASTQTQGHHQVLQRARGLEFAELCQYLPGDDVRTIDWRQTAKRGRVFTRVYQDEHARPVRLLVDMGPTMRFATRGAYKSVIAARVAARLAWQSVALEDQVGGMVFGVQGLQALPPRGQHQGALALLKQMAAASHVEPQEVALSDVLSSVFASLELDSELVIVSDFSALDHSIEQQISTIARQVDVKLIHIYDVFEQNPPAGRYKVTNGSTKNAELNLYSDSVRKTYLKPFELRYNALKKLAYQNGIPLFSISTEDNLFQRLSAPFAGKAMTGKVVIDDE